MNKCWLLNFLCNTNNFDIHADYKLSRIIKSNEIVANRKETNTGRKVFVKDLRFLSNKRNIKKEY